MHVIPSPSELLFPESQRDERIPAPGSFTGRIFRADRTATFQRNLIRWFVPESGVVEMYINPQNIRYNFAKDITNQRTKGGYLMQYWGEKLTQLTLSGTTGSSGVEGINVLHDIYRSEQVNFDAYALAMASEREKENDQFSFLGDLQGDSFGEALLGGVGESFTSMVETAIETGSSASTRAQPSIADLAFSVEMYHSGWTFRGYFTDFQLEESAERIGLFNYTMTFVVTQRRGIRGNFFAWHRQPSGPSDSDPTLGRPHSFNKLAPSQQRPAPIPNIEGGIGIDDVLDKAGSLVEDAFTSIF